MSQWDPIEGFDYFSVRNFFAAYSYYRSMGLARVDGMMKEES